VGGLFDKAQTFTVGISGFLSEVDILVNRKRIDADGNLLFDIRPTVDGTPVNDDAMILGSLNIPKEDVMFGTASFATSNFQWLNLDVSSFGIEVVVGEVLAIALKSDGTDELGDYRWGSYNYDPYSAGVHFIRGYEVGITSWIPGRKDHFGETHYDSCFRTYVDPIPEPATIFLLGSGLAGLLGLRRKSLKTRGM
jgi:hypothetical protein